MLIYILIRKNMTKRISCKTCKCKSSIVLYFHLRNYTWFYSLGYFILIIVNVLTSSTFINKDTFF